MNPNSFFIKFSGKANIPKPLELGNGYKVEIEGSIENQTDHNNNDGTFDRDFKFVPVLCTIITDEGKKIKAKDTRSRSSQLRRTLYRLWETDPKNPLEHEQHYDRFMAWLMGNKLYELHDEFMENVTRGRI